MTWTFVIVGILANAAASVLVKLSATARVPGGWLSLLLDWRLMLAVACYGLAFVAYAAAVARLPLNVAHPIATAGAILLVGLMSAALFRESFTLPHFAGYALLLAGIVVLALAQAGRG